MNYTPAHLIPACVRRRAAAEHEAGHALVAIKLGRRVTGAMLRPPDGLSGETQFEAAPAIHLDPNLPEDRRTIEDAIVVLMAGRIAETRYWRRVSGLYRPFQDSHRNDDDEIERLKAGYRFSPAKDAAYMLHCEKRTMQMVETHTAQAAIGEIAGVLWERLYIARAELDDILRRHGVP